MDIKVRMNMKRLVATLLVGFIVSASTTSFAASGFSDVKEYWATESINWAADKGIIVGDGAGNFLPTRKLTEAEFVTMICRMANIPVNDGAVGTHWSQKYYDAVKKFELPLGGYGNTKSSDAAKNTVMTRGDVARIVAAKYGFNLDLNNAVLFMYQNDLSSGTATAKTYENYGVEMSLQRDQAATFIHRIFNSGYTKFNGKTSTVKGAEIAGVAGTKIQEKSVRSSLADFSKLAPLSGTEMWNGMAVLSKEQREITYQSQIESLISGYRKFGTFDDCFKGADGKPNFTLDFGIANASAIKSITGVDPSKVAGWLNVDDPRILLNSQKPIVDKGPDGRYFMAHAWPWQGAEGLFTYNPANQNGKTLTTMAQVNALIHQPGILSELDTKTKNFLFNVLDMAGKTVIDTDLERAQKKNNYNGVQYTKGAGDNPAPFIYGIGGVVFYTDACDYGVAFRYDLETTGAPTDKPIGFIVHIVKKEDKPTDWGDFKTYFGGGHYWEISLDHDFADTTMLK